MGNEITVAGSLILGVVSGLIVLIGQAGAARLGQEGNLLAIVLLSILGLGIVITVSHLIAN